MSPSQPVHSRNEAIQHLHGVILGELGPGQLELAETTEDVVQRRSDPEVLLLEAERLALVVVFVRVQDSRDRLGFFGLANGGFVVTGVELGQVEADLAARGPKTDVAASARSRESE